MKTKLFILACFLFAGKIAYSQATYTMPVSGIQTDTACGGMFYDSGGPAGNYSNNENGIMIFCPAVTGQYVMMQFTSITLNDGGDRLRIFGGTDTLGIPLLNLAGFTSMAGCGTTIVSNVAGGCLTVHFRTDVSGFTMGWRAVLYCVPTPSAAPPLGMNCANPVSIPSIPFSDNGCTECLSNSYQTQAGICNATYAGEDRVYQYTAAGTETVCITMSNTTGNPALAVYQGCPGSGGTCISPTPMVGNDSMQVTFPSAGTYYIIIDETFGYSCYDLSITPPCIVGIDEHEFKDGVMIFPNPVTNELRIQNSELRIKQIEIYNAFGEKVLEKYLPSGVPLQTIIIADLTPAIYFISLIDAENDLVTKKIVKR